MNAVYCEFCRTLLQNVDAAFICFNVHNFYCASAKFSASASISLFPCYSKKAPHWDFSQYGKPGSTKPNLFRAFLKMFVLVFRSCSSKQYSTKMSYLALSQKMEMPSVLVSRTTFSQECMNV